MLLALLGLKGHSPCSLMTPHYMKLFVSILWFQRNQTMESDKWNRTMVTHKGPHKALTPQCYYNSPFTTASYLCLIMLIIFSFSSIQNYEVAHAFGEGCTCICIIPLQEKDVMVCIFKGHESWVPVMENFASTWSKWIKVTRHSCYKKS